VTVTWRKEGGPLPAERAQTYRAGELIITDLRSSDSGFYVCSAPDDNGEVAEERIELTVQEQGNVIAMHTSSSSLPT